MNELQRLVTESEIRKLKAKYFRLLDAKDWEGYASLYTGDAVFDATHSLRQMGVSDKKVLENAILRGGQAIAGFAKNTVGALMTSHLGHEPEIDCASESSASAIWPFEDRLWWPDNQTGGPVMLTPSGQPARRVHGYGHYHDQYVKKDGKWLFAKVEPRHFRVDLFN